MTMYGSPVVRDAVVEDLDGVLALDRRGRARLRHEARAGLFALCVLGVDELDGDARPEALVAALPDRPHAAAADEPQDLVFAGDETVDGGEGVTHRTSRRRP